MYLCRIPNIYSNIYIRVSYNDYNAIITHKNIDNDFMIQCDIIKYKRIHPAYLFDFFDFFDSINEKTIDLLFEHNYIERDDIFYIYIIMANTNLRNNIRLVKILYYMKKLYIESLIECKHVFERHWFMCKYIKWHHYKNIFEVISTALYHTKYKKNNISPYLYQIYEYLITSGAIENNYWSKKKIRQKYKKYINFSLYNTNKTKYIY